jgi:PhnB protein
MQLNPYLTFQGQCREAFEFYARELNGTIEGLFTFKDTPVAAEVPAEWRDKIMHASLRVGDQVLMGSDAPPGSHEPMGGFSVSLQIANPREAERVFAALAEEGTVRMPIQETFWAHRFGMCVDRFGVPWMVNCDKPEPA